MPANQTVKGRSSIGVLSTAILVCMGGAWMANAQSELRSPFGVQNKPKAWENVAVPSTPAPQTVIPPTSIPSPGLRGARQVPPHAVSPTYAQNSPPVPRVPAGSPISPPVGNVSSLPHSASSYQPQIPNQNQVFTSAPNQYQGQYPDRGQYRAPPVPPVRAQAPAVPTYAPRAPIAPRPTNGTYYPGRADKGQAPQQVQINPSPVNPSNGYPAPNYQPQSYTQNAYQAQQAQAARAQASGAQAPQAQAAPQRNWTQRWTDRLGLRNLATTLSGFLKIGAAATLDDGVNADFIGDGRIRGEASFITQGGLEYGGGLEARGQYDAGRRGFGALVGDCPPDVAGCPSVDIDGTSTSVRGHTSQFYTAGTSDAQDFEFALEGAYLFLRSGYGDITIGRDDGAAYVFSLGAPTLVAVGASNSPVDYTGLDSVKTVNDASGFAEKVTYTSPRLLGDTIGVGVQFGASYALNANACGVDYCARPDRDVETGTLSPDLDDVIEFGVSLDRKFDNGLSVEVTGTYARAKETSNLAVFDDLSSFGLGIELGYGDFIVGASYLDSNNGLADGDYTAWDVGLTWKPAAWGVTLGYGQSEDDNAQLSANQVLLGLSYDLGKTFTVGTGVQYVDRTVPVVTAGTIASRDEDAVAFFIEGKTKF